MTNLSSNDLISKRNERVIITDKTRGDFQTAKTNDRMNQKADVYADWNNEADNFFQTSSSGQQSEITGNKTDNKEDEESQDHIYDDSETSDLDTSDHEVNYIWQVLLAVNVYYYHYYLSDDDQEVKEVTNDKVEVVKENKKGPFRMSEENREEFMKAYRAMDVETFIWEDSYISWGKSKSLNS
ncbi:107_t:CDS:2 [Ambispora gerdemannii]|uniref:107_t:CDS:1 n=1 Tax=Ambispora gerdemannii TaxID=144530 RepID=A0A9N9FZM1_9GLOM|nr:107_t:CDS:2 [Ambispora gerdemannii]